MSQMIHRSDERYHQDIRVVLKKSYRPGDSLTLTRCFSEARKCEMCGDKVPIRNCFELQNDRTKERLVCGEKCIVNFAIVVEQMNHQPAIKFPHKYLAKAAHINDLRSNTVTVLPQEEFPDFSNWEEDGEDEEEREMLMDMGLDSHDPDFTELAPHAMSGDEDDDKEVDESEFSDIVDHRDKVDVIDEGVADGE